MKENAQSQEENIVIPSFDISGTGTISEAFKSRGIDNFRDAALFVQAIPYGRASNPSDLLLVLEENKGTCSAKHALLASLAEECGQPVNLLIGIYLMTQENTPGIGTALSDVGLTVLPEVHCYLSYQGHRLDFTTPKNPIEPTLTFVYEEQITPVQAGSYKRTIHKKYIEKWQEEEQLELDLDALWQIREHCIANRSHTQYADS